MKEQPSVLDDLKRIIALHSINVSRFNPDDLIEDKFSDEFDEMSWVGVTVSLEIIRHVEIPDDLAENHSLSFAEFARSVAALPRNPDRYWAAERVKMLQDGFLATFEDEEE